VDGAVPVRGPAPRLAARHPGQHCRQRFPRDKAFRDRLPRIEARYRKNQADTPAEALSSITLQRCWQIIEAMPERLHAVALLRWQQDMKEGEIAAVLGIAEKTVSAHLHRARRKLITQLGPRLPVHQRRRAVLMARVRQAIPSREDGLLAEFYRHVTEQQAARFSAEYDLPTGQGRYTRWLRQQGAGPQDGDADRAVTVLHDEHYRSLVRLAALLVRDVPAAEELVQDSFVALHSAWPQLRGRDDAAAFLRRSVVLGARALVLGQPEAAAGSGGPAVTGALRSLPVPQREAVVLRYYTDLGDDQIAAAMGISTTRARQHASRAMPALRAALQADGSALAVWQGEPG
jgi:DNA-directed RNA polymerase specialized sigma24 family protein